MNAGVEAARRRAAQRLNDLRDVDDHLARALGALPLSLDDAAYEAIAAPIEAARKANHAAQRAVATFLPADYEMPARRFP